MRIDNKFDIGQAVYLKTDPEQRERLVTAIIIRGYGILYSVSFETDESTHYDFEISNDKDVSKM